MKGIVFTEFMALTEKLWGIEMVDDIIDAVPLPSEGAYSSVASYDFQELADLLAELSRRVNIPQSELLQIFGEHLAQVFALKFPEFFASYQHVFDFLKSVQNHIHVEVLKLYPDAELPSFEFEQPDPDLLLLHYESSRPLADLAVGLIHASAKHFQQQVSLERRHRDSHLSYSETFVVKMGG